MNYHSVISSARGRLYEARFAEEGVLIRPGSRARVRVQRNGRICGKGLLRIGAAWGGTDRNFSSTIFLGASAKLYIDGKVEIYEGANISVNDGATLRIGSGYINLCASIDVFSEVSIGHGCAIAKGVTIRDSDNHSIDNKPISAPICIEDCVWIGTNSIILKGVTIGKGSVIAAGSVVTTDVPPGVLAGGVPAHVIRNRVTWS